MTKACLKIAVKMASLYSKFILNHTHNNSCTCTVGYMQAYIVKVTPTVQEEILMKGKFDEFDEFLVTSIFNSSNFN